MRDSEKIKAKVHEEFGFPAELVIPLEGSFDEKGQVSNYMMFEVQSREYQARYHEEKMKWELTSYASDSKNSGINLECMSMEEAQEALKQGLCQRVQCETWTHGEYIYLEYRIVLPDYGENQGVYGAFEKNRDLKWKAI